ncbi:MAG TPA: preprotein translocase subunit YajC [Lapillicoccus sp.]
MSEGLAGLLLPAMVIVLIAFMFWSQRRRQNAVAQLQQSLSVGDDVCTTSGLFGTITALDDVMATLEIAPGTRVRFDRRAIATKVDTSGRPITGADSAPTTPTDAPSTDPEK